MSQYDNPELDHSVNVSPGSPLGEFLSLSLWLALGTVLVVVAIYLGARWLAPWVPFSWEQRMAGPVAKALTEEDHANPLATCRQQWLQALAQDLRAPMGLPADMPITVHWSDSSVPNAFATLGGHVVIHQGLIDAVKSENALAMVLAHEMAHVKHRDPIVGLGGGLVVGLSLSALMGGSSTLAGEASAALSQLHFSRQQEAAADAAALVALRQRYGHLGDADGFFVAMQAKGQDPAWLEVLQSHPNVGERVKAIAAERARSGGGAIRPLPAVLDKAASATSACPSGV